MSKPPVILTVAGSDSSGGAGIQADLKTFTSLQCYGMSVITALTAQNTLGVQAVYASPPAFVKQQLHSVLSDIDVGAVKTGMLFDEANTRAVVEALKETYTDQQMPPIVVDPVCISTSGHTLLESSAVNVLMEELLPLGKIVTPNIPEAELMLATSGVATPIASLQDAIIAARVLADLSQCSVLLKGGHIPMLRQDVPAVTDTIHIEWARSEENMEILRRDRQMNEPVIIDILQENNSSSVTLFVQPHIESSSTHGTGCTLSAALACNIARGMDLVAATRLAINFTRISIETAFPLGKGHGPLNHLHPIQPRLIAPPTASNPYPFTRSLIQCNARTWKEYVQHPFVQQLGEGKLAREQFVHFIKQDYQYLKYYSRAYGLLIAKSRSFECIDPAADIIQHVVRETDMHKVYCALFGVSAEELESTPESSATTAYGAYLLDVGLHGDEMKLIVALGACLLGYGEVGLWLKGEAAQPGSRIHITGNPYSKWITDYSGDEYQGAVKRGLATLESYAANDPPSEKRLAEFRVVWDKCTSLEKGFWDMAMALS